MEDHEISVNGKRLDLVAIQKIQRGIIVNELAHLTPFNQLLAKQDSGAFITNKNMLFPKSHQSYTSEQHSDSVENHYLKGVGNKICDFD